jgi:hypothetical protein
MLELLYSMAGSVLAVLRHFRQRGCPDDLRSPFLVLIPSVSRANYVVCGVGSTRRLVAMCFWLKIVDTKILSIPEQRSGLSC